MSSSETTTNKRQPFSWTQPVCVQCWVGLKIKTGRAQDPGAPAFCCYCQHEIKAKDGRYGIRINPGVVPYPTVRKKSEEE